MATGHMDADNRMVLPKAVSRRLGLSPGDKFSVTLDSDGNAIIRGPKLEGSKSGAPSKDFPVTAERIGPKTRAALAASARDRKTGRTYGPFKSVDAMFADIEKRSK